MSLTTDQFLSRLIKAGVLNDADAEQARADTQSNSWDVKQLARQLIKQDKLTPFQADALLREKARSVLLGEYLLMDKLGAGGMGVVYKARHRRMDRVVAVKVLTRQLTQTKTAVERFYREIKATAKLSHPNIVMAYDASESQGLHYLVMEYIEGQDLADIIKAEGPMTVGRTLRSVRQAADALAYAHDAGIIHRDIKPANLFETRDGQIKVLDLGLARLREAEASASELSLTNSGHLLGTAAYMSPEHATNPKNADHRSDIYSLGCTLYRLLTGNPPYGGTTVVEIIVAGREKPIPNIGDAMAGLPDEPGFMSDLQAVFAKMVAKSPEDRYQSMKAVVKDLVVLIDSLPESLANRRGDGSTQAQDDTRVEGSELPSVVAPTVLAGGRMGGQADRSTEADTLLNKNAFEPTTGDVFQDMLGGLEGSPGDSPGGISSLSPAPGEGRGNAQMRSAMIGAGTALVLVLVGALVFAFSGNRSDDPRDGVDPGDGGNGVALNKGGNGDAGTVGNALTAGNGNDGASKRNKTGGKTRPNKLNNGTGKAAKPNKQTKVEPDKPGNDGTATGHTGTGAIADGKTDSGSSHPGPVTGTGKKQGQDGGNDGGDPWRSPRMADLPAKVGKVEPVRDRPQGEKVNLLDKVKLNTSLAVRGEWKLDRGSLIHPENEPGGLLVPERLPEAYFLSLRFTMGRIDRSAMREHREKIKNDDEDALTRVRSLLALHVTTRSRRLALEIDRPSRAGFDSALSGFGLEIDSEGAHVAGKLIQPSKEHHLALDVHPDRVVVFFDRHPIMKWEAPNEPAREFPVRMRLPGLATLGPLRITEFELTPYLDKDDRKPIKRGDDDRPPRPGDSDRPRKGDRPPPRGNKKR